MGFWGFRSILKMKTGDYMIHVSRMLSLQMLTVLAFRFS